MIVTMTMVIESWKDYGYDHDYDYEYNKYDYSDHYYHHNYKKVTYKNTRKLKKVKYMIYVKQIDDTCNYDNNKYIV